ncbi:hypothetical protein VDGD_05049 [Verticillium dahliae]|nr:hypothetical protein VDGD_05049 [Verticillium dahliae]
MASPGPACTGSPSYNLVNPSNTWNEWPENISGFVCKSPPIGYYSSTNFAKCCSGEVYNITEPVAQDHPFYPMSCAIVCLVDPELDASNDKYPYSFSEHFMCLNDFPEGEDTSGYRHDGEVVCATVTAAGVPAPTTFASTPTGAWQTKSYSDYGYGRDFRAWSSSVEEDRSSSTSSKTETTTQSLDTTASARLSSTANEPSTTESDGAAQQSTEAPSSGSLTRVSKANMASVIGCMFILSRMLM